MNQKPKKGNIHSKSPLRGSEQAINHNKELSIFMNSAVYIFHTLGTVNLSNTEISQIRYYKFNCSSFVFIQY